MASMPRRFTRAASNSGQRLLGEADAPGQQHVLAAGHRAGLLDRGLDAAGHERVAGAAALVDPLLAAMGHHEHGRVERRVLPPVRVAVVEHRAADDLRAEPGEVVGPHPGVHRVLPAFLALLLAPAAQREYPAQDRFEDRHAVRVGGLGTRYAV
jgi:hypothetical protein